MKCDKQHNANAMATQIQPNVNAMLAKCKKCNPILIQQNGNAMSLQCNAKAITMQ